MFKSKIYKGKNKLLNDIETEMQFVENKKVATEIKKNSFESKEITNVNKIDFSNYLKLTFDENLENKDTEENKQEINKEIDDLIENKKNQLCTSCIIL